MAVWSVVKLSSFAVGLRCDPEYYQPRYLADVRRLGRTKRERIGAMAFVTDGIHGSPEEVEDGGVRYLSAKCVKDNAFALGDALQISDAQHTANPRTSLCENDVLITTVGTIGNAAVVQADILPANSDRHLGIIRLNKDSPIDSYYLATFMNCKYGRFQSLREATGNVQLNLFIEKIRELRIPVIDCAAQVSKQTKAAYAKRREAAASIAAAEARLMEALELQRLDSTSQKYYIRNFGDLEAEARFDAEYFSPKYQRIIKKLRAGGRTLADVAPLAESPFDAALRPKGSAFRYIEIGSLTGDGEAEAETLDVADAPSRAAWIVKPGDVITSTVRPIRRLSALVRDDQDGCVCSSGFAVVAPKHGADGIEPEVLLTYLRLPIICQILDLHCTASMYPAIPEDRLMRIPIIVPDANTCKMVVGKVQEAMTARREAARLLEEAKKTIEDLVAGNGR